MSKQAWGYNEAAGRWAGFGPYYTIFPVDFARQIVETMSPERGSVLDPFCGRGTAPFVAQVTGRSALGIDINPAAWVFAKVKTSPESSKKKLLNRLQHLQRALHPKNTKPENEFQKWAWSEDVLGFLNTARHILEWREDETDRTLMGFILVHLHAKLGDGISNQMHKVRAVGPDYAVRWWKKRGMDPPEIDPYEYFRKRISWRYMHGVIDRRWETEIIQGDAAKILPFFQEKRFSLLFTSPPYFGITNYRQDSWIRLWMLGEGPPLPDWKKDKTTARQEVYRQMLNDVFFEASKLLKPYSVIWIRTDAREFTKNITLKIIRKFWPNRKLFMRYDCSRNGTQTAHLGNMSPKSKEVDFLIPGRRPLPSPTSSPWEQL